MEISLFALLGSSLVAMFFGYFFGLFEGRGQGYKKRKNEEASEPGVEPAVQIPPPSPPVQADAITPPEPIPPVVVPVETSLLKLSLDAKEQPCLDLDGQRVDTSQISAHERKRLIDLMLVMRPWVEAAPAAEQAAPVAATPRRMVVAPAAPSRVTPAGAIRTPENPQNPAVPTEPAIAAPTTMVGQIDAILQTRLLGTPLAARGIRLVESAEGGALVVVGKNRYAGVGEVPDPEVQAAIRAAIAEWENRYTPGL
jgi:hypothetical protein